MYISYCIKHVSVKLYTYVFFGLYMLLGIFYIFYSHRYIEKLKHLENIDFSFIQLSGSLPESIGRLGVLQTLNFFGNFVTGVVPETLGQLSALNTHKIYSGLF